MTTWRQAALLRGYPTARQDVGLTVAAMAVGWVLYAALTGHWSSWAWWLVLTGAMVVGRLALRRVVFDRRPDRDTNPNYR